MVCCLCAVSTDLRRRGPGPSPTRDNRLPHLSGPHTPSEKRQQTEPLPRLRRDWKAREPRVSCH